ncbi:hypothetical protein N7492_001958 [Penicillium capsulatum]|uniref:Uncharacterized protein n=1 Tax=Penicillium capsulatum TaxID=69766 RepID=A0A9W9LUN8_9EURO|nr:hypothetical protein N7492_001958 [Penicillium capsulatum]KAJ6123420.1 hypothetical protein N7512_005885 [Penicillium capsulatum]
MQLFHCKWSGCIPKKEESEERGMQRLPDAACRSTRTHRWQQSKSQSQSDPNWILIKGSMGCAVHRKVEVECAVVGIPEAQSRYAQRA